MSNEVWEEIYDRITVLIREHKTTLVFVNTRRMAEGLRDIWVNGSATRTSPRITAASPAN
jgi:Lhr-like helicase